MGAVGFNHGEEFSCVDSIGESVPSGWTDLSFFLNLGACQIDGVGQGASHVICLECLSNRGAGERDVKPSQRPDCLLGETFRLRIHP